MIFRAWTAVLVLWAIGAAALTLLCSDLDRWGLAAKLGLSFWVGLTVLTLTLFIASLCGIKPAPWLGLCEATALWAIALVLRRNQLPAWLRAKRTSQEFNGPVWLRITEVTLLIFLIGVFVVVSAVSLLEPIVEWDVIAVWALKAKVLLNESVITSGYFKDLAKAYSHLDYPLLWPLAIASVWSWTGQADLASVKVLAPVLLGSGFLLFFGLLLRKHSRSQAIFFTALLAAVPMLLSQTSRMMADVPLAFFALGAFVCGYFWLESEHPDDLRVTAAFIAGMLFIKNEGIGLWLILGLVATIAIVTERRMDLFRPAAVWLVIVPLLATLPWFVFRIGIPKVHEDYGGKINPVYFFRNISRVPEILSGSLGAFFNWSDWLLFWPLVLLLLIVAPRQWLRRPVIFLFLAATLPLLMYGYAYVVTPWNLKELMETTASRLLLQVTPLWVFLLAELARTSKLLPFDQLQNRDP